VINIDTLLPTFGFVHRPDAWTIAGYVPGVGIAAGAVRIGKAVAGHFFAGTEEPISTGRMGLEIFRGILEVLPVVGTFLLGVDAAVNYLRKKHRSEPSGATQKQIDEELRPLSEPSPVKLEQEPLTTQRVDGEESQDFAGKCWKDIQAMIPAAGSPVMRFRNLQCYRRSTVVKCPFPKGQSRQAFIATIQELCAPWAFKKEQVMPSLEKISGQTGIPVEELMPKW
jgi:hypothetical protein